VDVYFCVAGKITEGGPIQQHRNRFSDTFYVQFAKVEEQACRRSIDEIIKVSTSLGPLHYGSVDPYNTQAAPSMLSLVFRGVALQRLLLFMECVSSDSGICMNWHFNSHVLTVADPRWHAVSPKGIVHIAD
jgi:hypothetical protein